MCKYVFYANEAIKLDITLAMIFMTTSKCNIKCMNT